MVGRLPFLPSPATRTAALRRPEGRKLLLGTLALSLLTLISLRLTTVLGEDRGFSSQPVLRVLGEGKTFGETNDTVN